jgi:hypothetical protein
LRQWGLLEGWLTEDAGLLAVMEGIKRASHDWVANKRNRAWLAHQTDRLAAAERLSARPDLAASLDVTDRDYIAACKKAETDAKRGRRLLQSARPRRLDQPVDHCGAMALVFNGAPLPRG